MRWRRRHEWPDRPPRPKVWRLSADERNGYVNGIIRAIERSPVLSALNVEVHAIRGRFYIERCYFDKEGELIDTVPSAARRRVLDPAQRYSVRDHNFANL